MCGQAAVSRIPPKPVADWCRKVAIQLDMFAEIRDNIGNTGANGAETPPPPNQDREVTSVMTATNYSTTTALPQPRKTYPQDWPAYNAAQTSEKNTFFTLLADLCSNIEQPEYRFGRPRLPLADMVFTGATKVYAGFSARRFDSDVRDAQRKGYIDVAPSFNSVNRYIANPELTSLLKALVEKSALPLQSVETDFAVDSSGFSTSVYKRWFDHKWGKERTRQTWVKTHLMCGVKTHVVTAVEATPFESADSKQFPGLVEQTADHFTINEVSADKAYLSKGNLRTVEAVGGTAYIPFKVNSVVRRDRHKVDSLWQRMWHFYNFNREAFLEHYHKRSNVETTFSMVKAKFGGAVRSKTSTGQVNEVLLKLLCHNICVLIASMHELGITVSFESKLMPESQDTWLN